ncbi:MAG: FHA domain-containing protein [Sphaerospermopsis kisseleviana]
MNLLNYITHENTISYDLNNYTTILVGQYTGGKKPQIIVPNKYKFVSKVQCGFTLFPYEAGDRWVIKDGSLITLKNSALGTFVNNIRLGDIEIRPLKNNDIITFANQPIPYIKFIWEELANDQIKEENFSINHGFTKWLPE